ncbi:MAG: thiamine pyrophosphate-dependent enzyme [Candidatus Omnitrophota bacterium]
MKSREALAIMLNHLGSEDIALFTTGYISRYAFSKSDRPGNFYIVGSMGLVSSVGLGMALSTEKKVFIFDGDGSVLMDMGSLGMIASHNPPNLAHIVLDNESYESTGGQPTLTRRVDLSKIAKSAGYKKVFKLSNLKILRDSIGEILTCKGPVFILLKISLSGTERASKRVAVSPEELTSRIKQEMAGVALE